VLLGEGAVIPGTTVTLTMTQAGVISIGGNVNVFTDKDAFIYVYLDGEQIGPPFYTSVVGAWNNVPVFAMRNVPAGSHTVTLRGSANGSSARAGSRVVTVHGF
jgi:hypothetical protein